jgi:hypothetical protein
MVTSRRIHSVDFRFFKVFTANRFDSASFENSIIEKSPLSITSQPTQHRPALKWRGLALALKLSIAQIERPDAPYQRTSFGDPRFGEIAEDFAQMSGGCGMRNDFERAIERIQLVEQAKAAAEIHFRFAMAAIGGKFGRISRHFKGLLNAAAELEADPEIVCAVRMALLRCSPIELPCRK